MDKEHNEDYLKFFNVFIYKNINVIMIDPTPAVMQNMYGSTENK